MARRKARGGRHGERRGGWRPPPPVLRGAPLLAPAGRLPGLRHAACLPGNVYACEDAAWTACGVQSMACCGDKGASAAGRLEGRGRLARHHALLLPAWHEGQIDG